MNTGIQPAAAALNMVHAAHGLLAGEALYRASAAGGAAAGGGFPPAALKLLHSLPRNRCEHAPHACVHVSILMCMACASSCVWHVHPHVHCMCTGSTRS